MEESFSAVINALNGDTFSEQYIHTSYVSILYSGMVGPIFGRYQGAPTSFDCRDVIDPPRLTTNLTRVEYWGGRGRFFEVMYASPNRTCLKIRNGIPPWKVFQRVSARHTRLMEVNFIIEAERRMDIRLPARLQWLGRFLFIPSRRKRKMRIYAGLGGPQGPSIRNAMVRSTDWAMPVYCNINPRVWDRWREDHASWRGLDT